MMIRGIWLWAQVDKLLDEKGITSEPSAKNRELAAGGAANSMVSRNVQACRSETACCSSGTCGACCSLVVYDLGNVRDSNQALLEPWLR